MNTFVKRKLEATFVLGQGSFGLDGSDTVTIGDVRMSAQIRKAGGHAQGTLDLTIWGMTTSVMNQLSTLGLVPLTYKRNSVTIKAFDEDSIPSVVFQGQIVDAWIDAQSVPDVPFRISASTGVFDAVRPVEPVSFTGDAQIEDILSSIVNQLGVKLENNGVTGTLSNPYFYGSPRVQAQAVVDHADIEWNGIDDGILAIWPRGGSRGNTVIEISPDKGMIGYPAFSSTGIIVKTLFRPGLFMGNLIEVHSSFQAALDRAQVANRPAAEQTTGTSSPNLSQWVVISIDHDLDALVPQGQWFSTISASPKGYGPVPTR